MPIYGWSNEQPRSGPLLLAGQGSAATFELVKDGAGHSTTVARLLAVRDPSDYVLRWPSHIVLDELQRLVTLGEGEGVSPEWLEEVGTLLRQAFATSVPAEDFEQVRSTGSVDPIYSDEEPF